MTNINSSLNNDRESESDLFLYMCVCYLYKDMLCVSKLTVHYNGSKLNSIYVHWTVLSF